MSIDDKFMNHQIIKKFKAFLAISLLLAPLEYATAMTFSVEMMKGEPVIIGDGQIVPGDADRLRAVLTPRNKHSAGYFPLLLSSPGGNVKSAFELSRLMDKYPINTYVIPGARCVSACAAIVFIAGKEHIAVPGSRLGFHGCFNVDTKDINTICNDAIANHAFAHGTAYGSVMAFIQDIPYSEVIWLDGRDADCWAINRYQISPKPNGYEKCVFDAINGVVKK